MTRPQVQYYSQSTPMPNRPGSEKESAQEQEAHNENQRVYDYLKKTHLVSGPWMPDTLSKKCPVQEKLRNYRIPANIT